MKMALRFLFVLAVVFTFTGAVYAQTYSIGTNPQGSLFYSTGMAVSKVMVEKTGQQYRVAPYGGSSTYIPLINKGELAFGCANGGETAFAYKGTEIFDGKPNKNVRMIAAYYKNYGGYAVRNDSGYKMMRDLKGARIPSDYTAGRIFHYLTEAILAAEDLTHSDFKLLPVPNFVQGVELFIQGKVEAAYIPMNTGIGKKAMATIKGGWHFVDFDGSAAAQPKVDRVLPSSRTEKLSPGKMREGVTVDPTTMLVVDFYIIGGAHVADDVVYTLTKIIHDNDVELAKSSAAFNDFDPKDMAAKHPTPYHSGAIKYYKEIGIWKNN
ncbi:MAG: TAXI family TRAP transporter solute-binding subunit [Deltaproteobacteria bacterium]|nr:TAXI family TRAP transporter solute-binding subunit [Deltaproteobacteria bacterium]